MGAEKHFLEKLKYYTRNYSFTTGNVFNVELSRATMHQNWYEWSNRYEFSEKHVSNPFLFCEKTHFYFVTTIGVKKSTPIFFGIELEKV